MPRFKVWYSTESFADFVIANTELRNLSPEKSYLPESDASKPKTFHKLPDHIKHIVYLDCPDLIVECDDEPIFSIEESKEAGTGHNAFQRFARLAAAVENDIPSFYIYPEAKIIQRVGSNPKWDSINPIIFKALDRMMNIYNIPCLFHYFPSDYRNCPANASQSQYQTTKGLIHDHDYPSCPDAQDTNMQKMFDILNLIIQGVVAHGPIEGCKNLLGKLPIQAHREWMQQELITKTGGQEIIASTVSATHEFDT
jgi:hypothetical protein